MSANVYIDGFNLYYCAVKGTSFKWLNLLIMTKILFPGKTIKIIKYFSAKVKAFPHDLDALNRQDTYWRALRTIPNLEIIRGSFVAWPKLLPQFPYAYIDSNQPPTKPPQMVQVERPEEKGSDVNLAAYLIYDVCTGNADESIVISNDSDLVQAIELVTRKLQKLVTIVNPNRTSMRHKDPQHCSMQRELRRVATGHIDSINDSVLARSQFPQTLTDAQGSFSKPIKW